MSDDTEARPIRIYRASTDPGVFVATDREGETDLPPCPGYGDWEPYTETELAGSARVTFREDDAARDIERTGYHMFRVVVRPGEVG